MKEVSYCHSLFYATDAAEELAGLLVGSSSGEMAKAFIVSSGSEAIEAALKLVSRDYPIMLDSPISFSLRGFTYHMAPTLRRRLS